VPISRIVTPPLATDGYAAPVGTYTLTILAVDGRPPYADQDGDGLTNLREAELGTDPLLPDTDSDGALDAADNCPLAANPSQVDADLDGRGDACDNCPATVNPAQRDVDADGEGDLCDLDDGRLWFTVLTETSQGWQADTVFDAFNLYRGDLAELRGGGAYTQDPAAPAVDRFCTLPPASYADGYIPLPGEAVFYLVTGRGTGGESSLGEDSTGAERPNTAACPPE
jgi:hypothetical protein